MTSKTDAKSQKDSRAERLAAELRANLKKRKEQKRARRRPDDAIVAEKGAKSGESTD